MYSQFSRSYSILILGVFVGVIAFWGTSHAFFEQFFCSYPPPAPDTPPKESQDPNHKKPRPDILEAFGYKPSYGSNNFKPMPRPRLAPPPPDDFRRRMHRMHREDREDRMNEKNGSK